MIYNLQCCNTSLLWYCVIQIKRAQAVLNTACALPTDPNRRSLRAPHDDTRTDNVIEPTPASAPGSPPRSPAHTSQRTPTPVHIETHTRPDHDPPYVHSIMRQGGFPR